MEESDVDKPFLDFSIFIYPGHSLSWSVGASCNFNAEVHATECKLSESRRCFKLQFSCFFLFRLIIFSLEIVRLAKLCRTFRGASRSARPRLEAAVVQKGFASMHTTVRMGCFLRWPLEGCPRVMCNGSFVRRSLFQMELRQGLSVFWDLSVCLSQFVAHILGLLHFEVIDEPRTAMRHNHLGLIQIATITNLVADASSTVNARNTIESSAPDRDEHERPHPDHPMFSLKSLYTMRY